MNKQKISKEDFTRLLKETFEIIESSGIDLNFGHILAVVALRYFKEKGVTWASIECSIGGTSSSTNFLHTDIAVIVSIGLDHMDLLG